MYMHTHHLELIKTRLLGLTLDVDFLIQCTFMRNVQVMLMLEMHHT